MKATTIRLVRWFIILDVGTVDVSHPRLTNYTCVRRPAVLCTYGRLLFVVVDGWDSGCGCVWGGREGAGSMSYMLVVLSFAVLDVRPPSCSLSRSFEPPIFRQLILPTNAVVAMAAYLAFFVLLLGKFSIRILQQGNRSLSMLHSNSNQVRSLSYL